MTFSPASSAAAPLKLVLLTNPPFANASLHLQLHLDVSCLLHSSFDPLSAFPMLFLFTTPWHFVFHTHLPNKVHSTHEQYQFITSTSIHSTLIAFCDHSRIPSSQHFHLIIFITALIHTPTSAFDPDMFTFKSFHHNHCHHLRLQSFNDSSWIALVPSTDYSIITFQSMFIMHRSAGFSLWRVISWSSRHLKSPLFSPDSIVWSFRHPPSSFFVPIFNM